MTGDDRDDEEPIPDQVVLPLEDHLDLHAFAPRDVRSVTEAYLEQALAAGWTEVRVVHGRGAGVQREIVRALLARHPAVAAFHDAPPARGGWGATIVELVRPRPFDDPGCSGENEGKESGDGGKS